MHPKVEAYIGSVRSSIHSKNWHAALIDALILPDICGHLENPKLKSQERYTKWFTKYLGHKYASAPSHIWLSPEDCYALRCAIVHHGSDDITDQRCQKILHEFVFIRPGTHPFGMSHCVRITNCNFYGREFEEALALDLGIFCEDFFQAVEAWEQAITSDLVITSKMNDLMEIY